METPTAPPSVMRLSPYSIQKSLIIQRRRNKPHLTENLNGWIHVIFAGFLENNDSWISQKNKIYFSLSPGCIYGVIREINVFHLHMNTHWCKLLEEDWKMLEETRISILKIRCTKKRWTMRKKFYLKFLLEISEIDESSFPHFRCGKIQPVLICQCG